MLLGFADINDLGIGGDRIRVRHVTEARKDILRDESGKINRVLCRTVRRGIGKLDFAKIRRLQAVPHRLRNCVNALIDAF